MLHLALFARLVWQSLAEAYKQESRHRPTEEQRLLDSQAAERARLADEEDAHMRSLQETGAVATPSFRLMPAVPWTTSKFRISNAINADAWVEGIDLGGVDPTAPEGAEPVGERAGKKKKKTKKELAKEATVAKRLDKLEATLAKRLDKLDRKSRHDYGWLLRVFDLQSPAELHRLSRQDWDAARRYYEGLEADVRPPQSRLAPARPSG